jgi:multidrug resistance efflux pump
MAKEPITSGLGPTKELPPIPTPPGTYWREFRVRFVPLLVFGATLLLIFTIWKRVPAATGLRGVGEGVVSTLTSPQDGFIREVTRQPREWIQAGEQLVTIAPFDPGSRLDLLQSQLQLSRLTLEPSITDRNALNYEQLRVDSLRLRQELAMAKANLNRAERTLPRHEALVKERLLPQDVYELTVRDRDFYHAQVEETTKALEEIDRRLEQLRNLSEPAHPGVNPLVSEIVPKLEQQMSSIQTNWNPVTLLAPISGEVNFFRNPGEFVRAGEPVAIINSPHASHVVAYLKQPMPFKPHTGMPMEITTRSTEPIRFMTEIARVGARVEVITNALAYVPAGALVDSGLPLILPVPENIEVRPGEIVDIDWRPAGTNSTFLKRLFGLN